MKKTTARERFVLALVSPFLLLLVVVVLLGVPFYFIYRFLLRLLVEVLWVARGRRILFVYSRSPVWQEYVETRWLPLLRDHAVILNWSDRKSWRRTMPFAAWVFRHWAPARNYNPMVILFAAFPRTRHIGFYDAFRDWKHGNEAALHAAEAEMFAFVERLRGLNA